MKTYLTILVMLCLLVLSSCDFSDEEFKSSEVVFQEQQTEKIAYLDEAVLIYQDECVPCEFWYDCEFNPIYGEENICIDGCCEWLNWEAELLFK